MADPCVPLMSYHYIDRIQICFRQNEVRWSLFHWVALKLESWLIIEIVDLEVKREMTRTAPDVGSEASDTDRDSRDASRR